MDLWFASSALFIFVGFFVGWASNREVTRHRNRKMAKSLAASVQAVKSRRDPANMMSYSNRQRTAGNADNPTRARQGRVRFRTRPLKR